MHTSKIPGDYTVTAINFIISLKLRTKYLLDVELSSLELYRVIFNPTCHGAGGKFGLYLFIQNVYLVYYI